MQKIIGVTELQRRFKSILDEVVKEQVPYVLLRGSRAEAVLVPYEEYQRLRALEEHRPDIRARWRASSERLAAANAHFSDEEVEADAAAAVDEVRAARYAREQAASR